MTDRYTTVQLGSFTGWSERGRHGRAHMIAKLKAIAAQHLEAAQAILAAPDHEFTVHMHTGLHAWRDAEELKPAQTGEG